MLHSRGTLIRSSCSSNWIVTKINTFFNFRRENVLLSDIEIEKNLVLMDSIGTASLNSFFNKPTKPPNPVQPLISDPAAGPGPSTASTPAASAQTTATPPDAVTAPPSATATPPDAVTAPPSATATPPDAVTVPPSATATPPAASAQTTATPPDAITDLQAATKPGADTAVTVMIPAPDPQDPQSSKAFVGKGKYRKQYRFSPYSRDHLSAGG